MVDSVNRKKLLELLIRYMAGDIQWSVVHEKGFQCMNQNDPVLMELFYKILADRQSNCDHYITVIKLDWHYYVQMATFLQSDRELSIFHYFKPYNSIAEKFSHIFVAFLIPVGLYLWSWKISPEMLLIFFIPLLFTIVGLWTCISKSYGRMYNYYPNVKELPYDWPYDSRDDFEADYRTYATQVEIPLDRPDLTGKVSKANISPSLIGGCPAARPDEY